MTDAGASPSGRSEAARRAPRLDRWPFRSALVIVAHPDDETLWAGGTILMHPETRWTVVALCRRSDPDRAPKFRRVLERLGASGKLGALDDGPEQTPLRASDVEHAVLALIVDGDTDLILTHHTSGEYTRHRRHEETAEAVLALWDSNRLRSREVWTFAYRNAGAGTSVHAVRDADVFTRLPDDVWTRKHELITRIYGFARDSFESNAALHEEAFHRARPLGMAERVAR